MIKHFKTFFAFIFLACFLFSCMNLPDHKIAKCIPAEYSRDYILLVKPHPNRYRNNTVTVPVTRNGNTSFSNGSYTMTSKPVNFEKQVKKYFKGKYEIWVSEKVSKDDEKLVDKDSSGIKYPANKYRFVFQENIRYSNGLPTYTYNLYDRLEGRAYEPVRKLGTNLFAAILNGLNKKMGL
jgi:hypothetical protein